LECWFNDAIELRKGDIVKIVRAFKDANPLRVSEMENMTTNLVRRSRDEGVIMSISPVTLAEPIIGKIKSSTIKDNNVTYFVIEEGSYQDHVFVRAGEKQKGEIALSDILKNQLDTYVKICDPYVSPDTIKLLSSVRSSVDMMILTENIKDVNTVRQEATRLANKVSIRKGIGLHDRFILTSGEGWYVGHSLKDFGSKNSYLAKMVSSVDAESAFDDNWTQAMTVL
jgi:REP element-mobilizing transposase RayT